MVNLPLTSLKYLHTNLTFLSTINDDKIDILDANRIPYAIKYHKEIENFFCVADENGYLKFFKSYPKLKPVKEISAQKSCIYDFEWLNKNELACGGGDQIVSVYDVNLGIRTSILKGHTESVKSISQSPNPFVIASGSRDGSILVYDLRCNKNQLVIEQVDNFTNEPDQIITYIRSINSLQFASTTQANSSFNRSSNVLRSKTFSTLNPPLSPTSASSKRSNPVSCVLFQTENLLASAGATDGLIKIWDTRKLTSIKKHVESTPIYMLDNQCMINSQQFNNLNNLTPSSKKPISKGYSNLLFNSSKSLLYANCMNNYLYEYNFVTYNSNHTRTVNQKLNKKSNVTYHTNTSNFIKSSLSKCDNFILTGSSDFNAYIYPTSVNNQYSRHFKKLLPAIVLKGHTNEVTAVQWNPFDSNQLVTCSDDNTIRCWNVRRAIDELTTKECNFSAAQILNEFETLQLSSEENKPEENVCAKPDEMEENVDVDEDFDDFYNFSSGIRKNKNIYTKYRPHSTTIYDDFLFINYEYQNFMRKYAIKKNYHFNNAEHTDFEDELSLKYKNINLDKDSIKSCKSSQDELNSPASPTTRMLNSIESDLTSPTRSNVFRKHEPVKQNCQSSKICDFLSNLPINILEDPKENEMEETIETNKETGKVSHIAKTIDGFLLGRRQSSSSTLLSNSSTENSGSNCLSVNANKKLKAKTVKQRQPKQGKPSSQKIDLIERTPFNLESNKNTKTPLHSNLVTTPTTTGKKRTMETLSREFGILNNENIGIEPKTPQSKRRLVMPEFLNHPTTPSNRAQQIITASSSANHATGSPSRTILHYFSPKPTN